MGDPVISLAERDRNRDVAVRLREAARLRPDDTALRDTATGKIAIVSYGLVAFTPGEHGVLLIEEVE